MSVNGLLTQAAFAKRRGWSRAYVCQMVKRGKIPTIDGKIDPDAADTALAQTVDPHMGAVRRHHERKRNGAVVTKAPTAPPAPRVIEMADDEGQRDLDFEGMTQTEAQTAKLQIQAKRETLQYWKEVGEVVETVAVRKGISEVADAINQFSTIPDRLASRLAAETDVRRCHVMLMAEIDACMQAVADFAKALSERLAATPQ